MDKYTSCEMAYKKGFEDGKKSGILQAVKQMFDYAAKMMAESGGSAEKTSADSHDKN